MNYAETKERIMNSHSAKPPAPWPFIILFLIITISVIVTGIFYYHNQKSALLTEKQLELSSIADLKINQITQWRKERIGDGEFLCNNPFLINRFIDFLKDQSNHDLFNDIIKTLKSLTENFDYKNILLIDTSGMVKLAYPDQYALVGDHLKPFLPKVMKGRKVMLTDLHKTSLVGFPHLDLIIPLINNIQNDSLVKGFLVLRIDPQKVLNPLLQSWPAPSKSAETLIFRKEGEEVVYLNELRHMKNTNLILRKPLMDKNLPASMALQGITGTVDGIDYRNVHVVAAMKKVPGVSWYMVAKVDRDEMFSVINRQMKMVSTILVLFILVTGLFLGFLWRNQRVRFYREKYEMELNRQAIVKHFDYILKFANDIILLIDKDLNIIEANDRALEVYQHSREEFIGMKLENIRAPETLSQFVEQIRTLEENNSATFETFHRRKDNSIFPVEVSSRVVNIEGSKYYQTISRDITERKFVEDNLKESEARFRKIFEESPFSMIMTGKDYGILRANMSFINIIGYSEEELKSFTFLNFTHPDHIGEDEVSLMRLIAGEIPLYSTEKKYIRKDGSILWGSTTVTIIRNNKDEVQFFLIMIEDITSRKEIFNELEKSLSLLRATLESTEDGILVVDLKGKIVQYNTKFIEMWRIPSDILSSGEDSDALAFVMGQLKNPSEFLDNVKHLYLEPDTISSGLLEFADGRFFERYSQSQKIGGTSVGRVWSFRDITQKRLAERELIAAKEKAEENDRLKTAFLHNVSHEIRTPMNAIIGFSTLLGGNSLTEDERLQYIDIIFQSSNQLLSIINDIVDIANVESGQVKMNYTEMNLNMSLRTIFEQFSISETQGIVPVNLSTGLSDDEANIITDKTKLIQILTNLINNSKKFTSDGQIDFGYLQKGENLEFFVKDTGIGISTDHLEKIFDRFYQVDGTGSRQFGGTGLGLSICKAYVELLEGNIRVESIPGKGSAFIFTIPFRKANP